MTTPTVDPSLALVNLTVREAMRGDVVACRPDDDLASLAGMLAGERVHAIVLDPGGGATRLIVTDLDVLRGALSGDTEIRAHDLTRDPIICVTADRSLDELARMMVKRDADHVLVTEPDSGEPCGVVSSFALMLLSAEESPEAARTRAHPPHRPLPGSAGLDAVCAGDVMRRGVVTCVPDTPLRLVARTMAEQRVHAVAVAGVPRGGPHARHYAWGLVSASVLLRALRRSRPSEPVASIAGTAPAAVTQDAPLTAVAQLMIDDGTSHVVVVDPSGLACGMLSSLDLASVLASASSPA